MIKKPPSKEQLRRELQRDIELYLSHGDQINVIPKGVSSRDEANSPIRQDRWQLEKSSGERTYLPEVIDALEQRKNSKTQKVATKSKSKHPRKRLIYDDFGEPLRWVWVDE